MTGDIESSETKYPNRLLMLAVLLLSIAAVSASILIARTRVAGDLDIVWYRWSRYEVAKTILLIIAAPLVYYPIGFLIHKLGLPMKENLYFLADQRGLTFYIILTILNAVLVPVLEELFWRGYVQSA